MGPSQETGVQLADVFGNRAYDDSARRPEWIGDDVCYGHEAAGNSEQGGHSTPATRTRPQAAKSSVGRLRSFEEPSQAT